MSQVNLWGFVSSLQGELTEERVKRAAASLSDGAIADLSTELGDRVRQLSEALVIASGGPLTDSLYEQAAFLVAQGEGAYLEVLDDPGAGLQVEVLNDASLLPEWLADTVEGRTGMRPAWADPAEHLPTAPVPWISVTAFGTNPGVQVPNGYKNHLLRAVQALASSEALSRYWADVGAAPLDVALEVGALPPGKPGDVRVRRYSNRLDVYAISLVGTGSPSEQEAGPAVLRDLERIVARSAERCGVGPPDIAPALRR